MSHDQPGESPNDRTARFWAERHRDLAADAHDNFLNHPLIQAYVSLRAFGSLVGHLDVVVAELRSRTRPGDRVLSVGCGPAVKERALARALPDREFVGLDIAPETVARVAAECAAEGLRNLSVREGDFNDLQLERGSFRAILGLGAIHHVERLESFWRGCAHGLAEDGCVLAQEYVGADRFQWTAAQIEAGDAALATIVPLRYQTHHTAVERTPVEYMIAADPSEAARSSEILATCRDAGFEIPGYAGAGCALLQPVLMNQISAFDPQNWVDNHVLATLFREEDRLMREGRLGDDFAMFVAKPRR
ncbi:MAG: class I SAM-dependent methyltransferase [Planctomycetes bacterium]|nr:class I SAM-dependent methyltransferase [Planctomycetota bacterium]